MIKISHLNKSYGTQNILKDINLKLDKGLIFIVGPSGCGKTTLLNCIAGLIDFTGDVYINNISINKMQTKDKETFRLSSVGYVFQDFKLFNEDSVLNNISLPIQCRSDINDYYIKQSVDDTLNIVKLKHKKYEKVKNLSGGEKQKVAIARAIINKPNILLCDEPTGSLDSKNKIDIMGLLKNISFSKTVVVVSHDLDLAKLYADKIISLKDGFVIDIKTQDNSPINKVNLAIYDDKKIANKKSLPLNFIYRHSLNKMKSRRVRTFINNFLISCGLLGVGLSFVISDTIYSTILGLYSSMFSTNQITVTRKNDNAYSNEIESVNIDEAIKISNQCKDKIENIGVCYLANFEQYFKNENSLSLFDSRYKYTIDGYSARSINEFIDLNDVDEKIYPQYIEELKDDEIIIALDPFQIDSICYEYRIEKTIESLSNYILYKKPKVVFNFSNPDWEYHDEQIFTLKGFIISNVPAIYHSNPLWNEYIFEEQMRFSINLNLSKVDYYPWVLKKIYYLKLMGKNYDFLYETKLDNFYDDYIFEIADRKYYPWLYAQKDNKDIDRILIFKNNFPSINVSDWNYFKQIDNKIFNPIFSSSGGYSMFGSSILSGFSRVMFISDNIDDLDETTGVFASNNFDPLIDLDLPKNVKTGHFSKTSKNGVYLKGIENKKIYGRKPSSINEIVISRQIEKDLFNGSAIGKILHVASSKYNLDDSNNQKVEFQTTELIVVGVCKEEGNILYQNEFFSLLFFQILLNISAFDLLPISFSFEFDENINEQILMKKLSDEFSYYSFDTPLKDLERQTEQFCFYAKIILLVLSFTTFLISFCIMAISNYLHIIDIKKDIGLLRCIGVNNKEAKKLLYIYSLMLSLGGGISACIELLFLTIFSKFNFIKPMNISVDISFNLIAYIIMICLSIVIGIVPCLIFDHKIKKLDPLQAIKQ